MDLSKPSEFLRVALDDNEAEFDEDGLYSVETDKGIGFTFVYLPPELRLYASPLAPEDYETVDDKASFLEALLAINYQSDNAADREFKVGFHPRVRVPMIAAVTPVEQLKIEVREVDAMRKLCDDLHRAALEVRERAFRDTGGRNDGGSQAKHEPEGPDSYWSFDGPGLRS